MEKDLLLFCPHRCTNDVRVGWFKYKDARKILPNWTERSERVKYQREIVKERRGLRFVRSYISGSATVEEEEE